VPATIAIGAAIGASRPLLGYEAMIRTEDGIVGAVRTLMGPEMTNAVISPFVHAQLQQANGGVAIGALLAAWWLAGRLIAATAHALDSCYGVTDARQTFVERMIALGFALASVLLVTATVEMMVVGPLGSANSGPASWLGLGDAYSIAWSIAKWPILLAVVVGFLLCLYRVCANVRQSFRDCLPGALLGATLWIIAAVGFRLSAPLGLHGATWLANGDPVVTIIGESVNAVVATVLWAYFASLAILAGGELNATLQARHGRSAGEHSCVSEAQEAVRAARAAAPIRAARRSGRVAVPVAAVAPVPATASVYIDPRLEHELAGHGAGVAEEPAANGAATDSVRSSRT
jgi:membrane protein